MSELAEKHVDLKHEKYGPRSPYGGLKAPSAEILNL